MTESWTRWSDAHPELPPAALRMLESELGPLVERREARLADVRLPPSRLPAGARAALVASLGPSSVRDDDTARAMHAGGQSYSDVMRRRMGDAGEAPDAVVTPASAEDVATILGICADHRVAVVPWGGGTSVVGGLDALHDGCSAVVALDLAQLDALLEVDETSLLATFQPGIRTPAAEAALARHGLTLGHVPQSFERASLGGYVVTRSAGQSSTGVGRIDDLVAGLRLTTPTGEMHLPPVAGSAAGPDLRRLVLGSEGTLGVVTEVTLRVRRQPATRLYEGWMLPNWDSGLTALRRLAQEGPHPDIARLSDPQETTVSLAMSRSPRWLKAALARYLVAHQVADGCLVITGYEGSERDVRQRRDGVREILRDAGGVRLGTPAGKAWEHSRFAAPALRDVMLDRGVLAETLETAATWSRLPDVHAAVRRALQDSLGRVIVGCHVSHLYATGASLYFTVLAAATPAAELDQWQRAKNAANDAIVAAGGTITHHHGVGTAHRDHVATDLGGPVGVAALRAVKDALDPAGILNPGKLLPSAGNPEPTVTVPSP